MEQEKKSYTFKLTKVQHEILTASVNRYQTAAKALSDAQREYDTILSLVCDTQDLELPTGQPRIKDDPEVKGGFTITIPDPVFRNPKKADLNEKNLNPNNNESA